MVSLLKMVWKHFPILLAASIVVLNALIDTGYLTLPSHPLTLINMILIAIGMGTLHVRQA